MMHRYIPAKPAILDLCTGRRRSSGFSIVQLVFLWLVFSCALFAQIVDGGFEGDTAGSPPPSPWAVTNYLNPSNTGFTVQTPQNFGGLNLSSGGYGYTKVEASLSGPLSQHDVDLGVAASFRWPRYGNESAIVNQHGASNNANSLSQTFTIGSANVDPADGKVHIRFVFAPVLENPGHAYNDQPYYFIQLTNITQNTVLYEEFGVAADASGIPWQSVNSNQINFKNWQLIDITPGSPAVNQGDSVELQVFASGCALGGHWGEVYVDGVGTTIPGISVEGTGPTLVKPGANLTYSFNYQNGAQVQETGVVLQFTTPPDTTFQSLGSHPYTCTTPTVGTAGTVVCNIGTLAAAASGSLSITVNVATGIPAGSLIERNYSISSTQETLLVGTAISTQIWSAADTVTASPSLVNFGSVAVAAATGSMQTVTFTVPSVITLGSVSAVTQGAPNLDFTVVPGGTTCASGTTNASCTVEVQFLPIAPGMRLGAIVLYDTAAPPNVLATVYLTGTGLGSAIAFSPSSQITVPVTGLNLSAGVALDAAGDVFIADSSNGRVVEVTPGGTQTTIATGLSNPLSLAVDGVGNVFIADSGNNRVVEVMPSGAQTTVPATGLNVPKGVAVDGAGNIFIADSGNSQVVEVTPSGIQTTVPATGLSFPSGVAVDGAGNIFIADSVYNQVVEVPAGGGAQTTVPATGLSSPGGVAVDGAGNIFIADSGNNRVVEVTPSGIQTTVPVIGLSSPNGVALDGVGDVFIADVNNSRAVEVQRSVPLTLSFASTAVGSTSTDSPQSVTIQNIGNQSLNAISPGLSIGSNFVQVAGSGQPADCSSSFSLVPGANCNLSISFSPQSVGNIVSAATFTDNALNAAAAHQSLPLQGTGTQGPASEGTTILLQTSAATVLSQSSVILTTTVSSASVTPVGSVNFFDGTTPLGSATLDNTGKATLTTSSLSVGSHSITAVYAGIADFTSSTSSAITETVQDFSFVANGATATVLSATVMPGDKEVYTVQFTPQGSSTFVSAVALTLTGLPAGASYAITPSAIAAGGGTTTVTVAVTTSKQQTIAAASSRKGGIGFPKPALLAFCLPLFGMRKLRRAVRAQMKSSGLMLVMLAVLMVAGMTACDSGSGFFSQAPQTYPMTLTGTSGALHHSVTLNLTVQ